MWANCGHLNVGIASVVVSPVTIFNVFGIILSSPTRIYIIMDRLHRLQAEASANPVLTSEIAADAWRVPPSTRGSETSTALAAGAVIGSAILMIATRGKGAALLAKAGESSSGAATKAAQQAVRAESQTNVVASISHEVRPSVSQASEPAPFKPLYPVSHADDEILARVQKRSKLQETSGEVAKHPLTGEPLTLNERFYANYIDEMPRKSVAEYLESGHLVPAIYKMNFNEFAREFGNGIRRQNLLANFEEALQGLRQGNVKTVHVGGSFVSKKPRPNDIDFMWDRLGERADFQFLSKHRYGALVTHDSHILKDEGLQMMIKPPENGTYKGIQYFFAHHAVPYQGMRRGAMRTLHVNHPNGLVELDLTTLPARTGISTREIAV